MIFTSQMTIKYLLLPLLLTVILSPLSGQPSQPVPEQALQNRVRTAQNYERRQAFASALKIYKELYQAVPTNQLYYDGYKRNLVNLKRFPEALSLVRENMQRYNHVRYYADLGDVLYQSGQVQEAIESWDDTLLRFQNEQYTYTYLANAMVSNRLYDRAIDVYLKGRAHFQKDELFVFELANIYVLRLKYREATIEYLKHLERSPTQFAYVESRIVNYTKDPEQAQRVVQVLADRLPKHKQPYLVRKLMADLYLRIEEYALALEQFRKLEKMDPGDGMKQKNEQGREIFFFADKALKAGKYEFADEAFAMILEHYSNSRYRPRALYGLALCKRKQGAPAEALLHFQKLISLPQQSAWSQAALFEIGELYYEELFDLNKALDAYQMLISKYPKNSKVADAYFRIGDCHAARGDFSEARNWYEKSIQFMTGKASNRDEGRYKMAYLDFVEGNYAAALEQLHLIIEKMGRPDVNQDFVNDALELSFLIEENQNDSEEALKLYSKSEKSRLVKDYQAASDKLNQILSDYPTAGVLDEALQQLGELENERGNYPQAISYFEQLLKEHSDGPYTALAQKRIAEIYELGLGDLQKAYGAYEKILVDYPNCIYIEDARNKLRELGSQQLNN